MCHAVAQCEVALQRRTAQIQITVFHTQVVAAVRVLLDGEWRRLRLIQDDEFVGRNLDVARRHLGVLRRAFNDAPFGLKHVFAAEVCGHGARLFGRVFFDDDLRDAVTVAQVDKGHGAEVTHLLHPSGERHRTTDVAAAQFAASMTPVHNIAI